MECFFLHILYGTIVKVVFVLTELNNNNNNSLSFFNIFFLFASPEKIHSQQCSNQKVEKIIIIRDELRHNNNNKFVISALLSFEDTHEKQSMNITLNTVLKINTIVGAAYASNVLLGPAK